MRPRFSASLLFTSIPLLAALAAALTLGSAAGARPMAWGNDHLGTLEGRVSGLDVDDLIREACYAEIDSGRQSQRAAREQLLAAHEEMRALLEQPEPSELAVLAQADQIAVLLAETRKAELRTLLRVLSLLDDAARAELRARPAHFREQLSGTERGFEGHRF